MPATRSLAKAPAVGVAGVAGEDAAAVATNVLSARSRRSKRPGRMNRLPKRPSQLRKRRRSQRPERDRMRATKRVSISAQPRKRNAFAYRSTVRLRDTRRWCCRESRSRSTAICHSSHRSQQWRLAEERATTRAGGKRLCRAGRKISSPQQPEASHGEVVFAETEEVVDTLPTNNAPMSLQRRADDSMPQEDADGTSTGDRGRPILKSSRSKCRTSRAQDEFCDGSEADDSAASTAPGRSCGIRHGRSRG